MSVCCGGCSRVACRSDPVIQGMAAWKVPLAAVSPLCIEAWDPSGNHTLSVSASAASTLAIRCYQCVFKVSTTHTNSQTAKQHKGPALELKTNRKNLRHQLTVRLRLQSTSSTRTCSCRMQTVVVVLRSQWRRCGSKCKKLQ